MSKISNKVFAVAMMAMMVVSASPAANAQTASDLQAQIQALLAQIAQLQNQLGSGSGSGSGSAPSYNFTRNLTVGSRGDDVKALQQWLNANGYTVSASGAGSAGNETTYFGPATRAALAKFQAANSVSPAAGYFGPLTRNKLATMGGGGVVIPPTVPGSSAVVIHPSSPSARSLVTNQSMAELARYKFNGNYTVTGITLQRIGLSADASLANVFLFDGDTRLSDSASVTSNSMITFSNPNGIFSVNGTRDISVRADLAGSAGETIGVRLVSYTISGGSPVTVNLSGATHSLATATLAGVALSAASDSGNTEPGNDVLVWQGTATVTTRDVLLNRLALRQIGSIASGDIRNFRLYVDGALVSTVANLDANGYVSFNNVSKAMMTGARTVKVLADVVGGSNRTVEMSLRGAYDITVTDTQYNVSPTVTGSFPFDADGFTVSQGSITVIRTSDSPSSNVTLNGTDVLFGKFTVTAYGEPVKLETLTFSATSTDAATTTVNAAASLRNGRVVINGSQYGSTATIDNDGTSFTTNYTVNPGSPVTIEVRGDVFDNDGTGAFEANDTIRVTFEAGSANAVRQISLGSLAVPGTDTVGSFVTVTSGSLSLTKEANYGNQTAVVPQTAYKLADFNLSAGSAEDINVTEFVLTYTTSTGNTLTAADLTDVYIKYGTSQTPVKATVSGGDSFSVNYTVPKNTSVPVEVYANIGSDATATHAIAVNVAVTATTASGVASNVSATAGQTIAAGSGTVTIALDTNASPVSAIVDDNTTQVTNVTKFTAANDSYKITEVDVNVSDVTAVTEIQLWFNGAQVASRPAAASTLISGLNLDIPMNTTRNLETRLVIGTVGVGAGSTGAAITTTFDSIKYQSSNGTVTTDTTDVAGNAMYVYKAIPTISKGNVSTLLSEGDNEIAKVTVSGDVLWKKAVFEISLSGITIADASLWKGSTQVTATVTTSTSEVAVEATNEQGTGEYTLKATLNGVATGDSIATKLDSDTTFAASGTYASTSATGANFVWSDQSALGHSTSTSDWANDYLIKVLPLNWSVSK